MRRVAIVGAGGLVGSRMVRLLDHMDLSFDLLLTGRNESVGKTLEYKGKSIKIVKTNTDCFAQMDMVVLCTPTKTSIEMVKALRGGPVILDTSNAFRMDEDVPLVVPEVNGHTVYRHNGLIAGPNCSTIQLVIALAPIHKRYGLKRVYVSTYQSVSGIGYKAVNQTEKECMDILTTGVASSHEDPQFPYQMAFNVIPQIDSFLPGGYTKEEMKIINETKKIMDLPGLEVSCTAVRVPVIIGHSEACFIETR